MAKLYNLARMTTATVGTGTITLGSASPSYLTFALAGVLNGDIVDYAILDGANSEIGTGTYTSAGTTLTRTVTKSTNSNAAISLSGTATVFIDARAETIITAPLIRSYLAGLTLSSAGGSSTFGISAGVSVDSTNFDTMILASAYTKTTGAWAVGTANGALDTGAIANATWYHVYEIKRPDTGVVDIAISLSASSPTTGSNIPVAYTLFRRIGSMLTNNTAFWLKFNQLGDEFLWDNTVQDANAVALSTVVSAALSTPPGVQTQALIFFFANPGSQIFFHLTSLDSADIIPSVTSFTTVSVTGAPATWDGLLRTDTSRQIRIRASASVTGGYYIQTRGYIDRRGRDA